jgi:hypothetical protein
MRRESKMGRRREREEEKGEKRKAELREEEKGEKCGYMIRESEMEKKKGERGEEGKEIG